jgi:hypothetical protein
LEELVFAGKAASIQLELFERGKMASRQLRVNPVWTHHREFLQLVVELEDVDHILPVVSGAAASLQGHPERCDMSQYDYDRVSSDG